MRWLMRTSLNSEAKIRDYQGPLLQGHGTEDRLIPFDIGKRLHAAAGSTDKRFVEMVGNGRFVLPLVKRIEFAPVALEMAGEVGEKICVEGDGTGRHDDVAGLESKVVVKAERIG